jgi:SAM-dependent methyltransferase
VDGTPSLLERAAARGVTTRLAELPGELDTLGTADLVWAARVVHHLGDQQAALNALARRVRPGGLLAISEGGLPPRFLPRDIGRPGLQARLDAANEEWFAAMRAALPDAADVAGGEDWPAMLARTGLTPVATRSFLTELRPPLDDDARELIHGHLTRVRETLADHLDPDDVRTIDALLDPDAPTGIRRRTDAFYLTATTVHTARRA